MSAELATELQKATEVSPAAESETDAASDAATSAEVDASSDDESTATVKLSFCALASVAAACDEA